MHVHIPECIYTNIYIYAFIYIIYIYIYIRTNTRVYIYIYIYIYSSILPPAVCSGVFCARSTMVQNIGETAYHRSKFGMQITSSPCFSRGETACNRSKFTQNLA